MPKRQNLFSSDKAYTSKPGDLRKRFTGTCQFLAKIDVGDLIAWITSVKREDWPGNPWNKPSHIPCVIVDPLFLQDKTDQAIAELMLHFPGCQAVSKAITVINPGDHVPTHIDSSTPEWITKVHVPIISNREAWFKVDDQKCRMEVGSAYRFNHSKPHSLGNNGKTPRIHLMFDVMGNASGS